MLYWFTSHTSIKKRRVKRSVMEAELVEFSDIYNETYFLCSDLEILQPGVNVAMHHFAYINTLLVFIIKNRDVYEKRVIHDVVSAAESSRNRGISDIWSIPSESIFADGLRKFKMSGKMSISSDRGETHCSSLAVDSSNWFEYGRWIESSQNLNFSCRTNYLVTGNNFIFMHLVYEPRASVAVESISIFYDKFG